MEKKPGIRLIFIFIVVVILFIPLFDTFKWIALEKDDRAKAEMKFDSPTNYYKLSPEDQKKIDDIKEIKNKSVKLGLDLQGGMYVVLKAETTNLSKGEEKRDAVNKALVVIRNRVDQFGVSEPSIMRQGQDRIIVELPGVKDPKRVKKLLDVRGKLEFKIVDEELSQTELPIPRRDNFKDMETGKLKEDLVLPEDKEVLPVYIKEKDSDARVKKYYVIVNKEASLTGAYLKTASVDISQFGDAAVSFKLKSEGAEQFFKVTSENIGKQLAIVLDGKVQSHPKIQDAMKYGGQITGNFKVPEAQDLALILRAGAIPVDLKYMEQRIVGASLGEDSIKKGVKAGLIGMMLVVLFMLVYYKFAGFIANFTLFLNMYFLLSILVLLKFTLTLPGLAGIVLTIGMAVDANVLIFERIKEELRTGKSLRASIDAGFEKAYRTILDANVTTLITAFILSQFGTGPIKGFAYTLLIGVSANLFTAVYVSHNIFNYIVHKFGWKRIAI